MANDQRPILITGCPRSGTTWVGTTIGSSPGVVYVYEPFNDQAPHHFEIQQRFAYIPPDAPGNAVPEMPELLELASLRGRVGSLARAVRMGRHFRTELPPHLAAHKLRRSSREFLLGTRVCIKDPLAFFAAEWLADRHDAQVVVLMRHPAGMISSYLKLGWAPETPRILIQPGLRRRYFSDFEDEIDRLNRDEADLVSTLILQWKMFAVATLQLRKERPDWIFVMHESICEDPSLHFRGLFEVLGLDFNADVEEGVRARSRSSNQADPASHQQHMLVRDSKSLSVAWRKRLDSDSREHIEAETQGLWKEMNDIAWNPEPT